jgi:hypothetical protein
VGSSLKLLDRHPNECWLPRANHRRAANMMGDHRQRFLMNRWLSNESGTDRIRAASSAPSLWPFDVVFLFLTWTESANRRQTSIRSSASLAEEQRKEVQIVKNRQTDCSRPCRSKRAQYATC